MLLLCHLSSHVDYSVVKYCFIDIYFILLPLSVVLQCFSRQGYSKLYCDSRRLQLVASCLGEDTNQVSIIVAAFWTLPKFNE